MGEKVAGFRLTLFGVPELCDAEQRRVKLRTRKQLALLVYLALEARTHAVSRDALADLLWPGVSEARARHSLSQALSAIRHTLGQDALRQVNGTVRLTGRVATDFDAGPAMNGNADYARPLLDLDRCGGGAGFAQWVDSARQRCRRAARVQLHESLERARVSGDLAAVHERAEVLYAVDPTSAAAARALAEGELLRGDSVAAVRVLRQYVAHTGQELGCAPPADIARLLRRLENGRTPAAAPDPTPVTPAAPGGDVFVGRDRELEQLEHLWAEARAGALRACLVTGPAGIGKSALVRRFATTVATRGGTALVVNCQEIGSAIPYATVADIIRELAHEDAVGGTDPMWLAEASRVYAPIRTRFPGVPEPGPVPGEAVRMRVAEAVSRMIEAVAEDGPTLLVLDDIQHLDPASRETLHVLFRRIDRSRFLLLGTQRTLRTAGPAAPGAAPVSWDRVVDVVPLTTDQLITLVTSALTSAAEWDDRVCAEIVNLADGNPYFAEMLIQDWLRHRQASLPATHALSLGQPWSPPESLRLAFARQSAELPPEALEVLRLLSTAARALTTDDLAEALRWGRGRVDGIVSELLDRGVVRFDSGRLGYKNELHRVFVYYAMSGELRKFFHSRIGQLLRTRRERGYQDLLHAAHHFVQAGMLAEARGAVVAGADEAIAHGAPQEAERALNTVFAAEPTADQGMLSLQLARALFEQGRYGETLAPIERCLSAAPPPERAALAYRLRAQSLLLGRLDTEKQIQQAARRAVASARLSKNLAATVSALQAQAEAAADISDGRTLRQVARKSDIAFGRADDPRIRGLARLTRGYCLMMMGQSAPAAQAFKDSAEYLCAGSLDSEARKALNGLGICSTNLARFEAAIVSFKRAIEIALRSGDAHSCTTLYTNLGAVYELTGQFESAKRCMEQALSAAEFTASPRPKVPAFVEAAWIATISGDISQAEEFVRRAHETARLTGVWTHHASAAMAEACFSLALQQRERCWTRVAEINRFAGGRLLLASELGMLPLLRRLWTLEREGYAALEVMNVSSPIPARIVDRLELAAFQQWADEKYGRTSDGEAGLRGLYEVGAFGCVANLATLRVCPGVKSEKPGLIDLREIAVLLPTLPIQIP